MPGNAQPSQSPGALASMLAPTLVEACGGRLSDISWFRADWQRGGAATGYCSFSTAGLAPSWAPVGLPAALPAVIKLPVGPVEYRFAVALSEIDAPTPRVLAHGAELGGYDLAWLIMERLPGEPLSSTLHKECFTDMAEACAGFQKHARDLVPLPPDAAERADPDWAALLDRARAAVKDSHIPEHSKWNDAIKHTQKALPRLLAAWRARPIACWRHGDLHGGNCMRRPPDSPFGPPGCILLDFAEVQPGHWAEDAVYLERMHWGRLHALEGVKPVSLLAKARRALGLETDGDYGALMNIRRVLSAASIPAFLDREGNKAHLHTALETLERLLPVVAK